MHIAPGLPCLNNSEQGGLGPRTGAHTAHRYFMRSGSLCRVCKGAGLSVLLIVTPMMQVPVDAHGCTAQSSSDLQRAKVSLKGGPPRTDIPMASHADFQIFLSLGALCAGAPAKAPVAAPMMAPATAPAAAAKAPAPGASAGAPAPMGAAIATGGGIIFSILPESWSVVSRHF